MKRSICRLSCVVIVIAFTEPMLLGSEDAVEIGFSPIVPVVDGFPEETWEAAAKRPIDRLLQGDEPPADDLAATWQALADEDHLYFLFLATDESRVFAARNRPLKSDAVEVYVDLENSQDDRLGPLQHRFRFTVGNAPVEGTRWEGVTFRKRTIRIMKPVRPKNEEEKPYDEIGYCIEARIPWDTIGGRTGRIGLQFVVSDYDHHESWDPEAVVAARTLPDVEPTSPRSYLTAAILNRDGSIVAERDLTREHKPSEGTVVFSDDFGVPSRGKLVENIIQLKPPQGLGYRTRHPRGYLPKHWVLAETLPSDDPRKGFWVIAENEPVLIQAGRSLPSAIFAGTPVPDGVALYDVEFQENRNDNDYIGYIIGASSPVFEHDGVEFGSEIQIPLTDVSTPNVYYRGALGRGVLADRAFHKRWAQHRIEVRGDYVRWIVEGQIVAEGEVPQLQPGGYFGIVQRSERDTRYDDVRIVIPSEPQAVRDAAAGEGQP